MSALLSLKNIWVEYGDKVVLEKVNIEVTEGAFLSIIGPSGAGKSSLLRLILGQEAPTRGTIQSASLLLSAICREAWAKRGSSRSVTGTAAMPTRNVHAASTQTIAADISHESCRRTAL